MRNRVWNEVVKNAGLRYRTPYQTRHNFASLMLEENAAPACVAKMLEYMSMRCITNDSFGIGSGRTGWIMKPHYRKQWQERSVAIILKPSLENRKDYSISCKL